MRRLVADAGNGRRLSAASRSSNSKSGSAPGTARACMSAPEFLDTNVLLYAYDPTDRRKQEIAQDLVRKALAGDIIWSIQVLAEFTATLLHKISIRAHSEDVQVALDALVSVKMIVPDAEMVR